MTTASRRAAAGVARSSKASRQRLGSSNLYLKRDISSMYTRFNEILMVYESLNITVAFLGRYGAMTGHSGLESSRTPYTFGGKRFRLQKNLQILQVSASETLYLHRYKVFVTISAHYGPRSPFYGYRWCLRASPESNISYFHHAC